MSKPLFFSYDGDGLELHDTAEEARGNCEAALDHFRDNAGDGWSEEVESVKWGQVMEKAEPTDERDHLTTCGRPQSCDDDCPVGNPDVDCLVDYRLTRIPPVVAECLTAHTPPQRPTVPVEFRESEYDDTRAPLDIYVGLGAEPGMRLVLHIGEVRFDVSDVAEKIAAEAGRYASLTADERAGR